MLGTKTESTKMGWKEAVIFYNLKPRKSLFYVCKGSESLLNKILGEIERA